MARRTTPQAKTDDLAFPVRVKIVVPPHGLGRTLTAMYDWLQAELQRGDFAQHSQPGFGGSTAAFYFRTTAAAQRFVDAFPEAALADGTRLSAYYSPSRSAGS